MMNIFIKAIIALDIFSSLCNASEIQVLEREEFVGQSSNQEGVPVPSKYYNDDKDDAFIQSVYRPPKTPEKKKNFVLDLFSSHGESMLFPLVLIVVAGSFTIQPIVMNRIHRSFRLRKIGKQSIPGSSNYNKLPANTRVKEGHWISTYQQITDDRIPPAERTSLISWFDQYPAKFPLTSAFTFAKESERGEDMNSLILSNQLPFYSLKPTDNFTTIYAEPTGIALPSKFTACVFNEAHYETVFVRSPHDPNRDCFDSDMGRQHYWKTLRNSLQFLKDHAADDAVWKLLKVFDLKDITINGDHFDPKKETDDDCDPTSVLLGNFHSTSLSMFIYLNPYGIGLTSPTAIKNILAPLAHVMQLAHRDGYTAAAPDMERIFIRRDGRAVVGNFATLTKDTENFEGDHIAFNTCAYDFFSDAALRLVFGVYAPDDLAVDQMPPPIKQLFEFITEENFDIERINDIELLRVD